MTPAGVVMAGAITQDNGATPVADFLLARFTNDELPPSTVAGKVYLDVYDDRKQDATDPGERGIVVFLDANSNGKLTPANVR